MAVAAGRLLGLDVERMQHAIGIAATEAGGVLASRGSMTKPFHVGKAAFDGIEAAFMAQLGIVGIRWPRLKGAGAWPRR